MSDIKIGLIGGTGIGQAFATHPDVRRHEVQTPFGAPSDAILEAQWDGQTVYFLSRHGPGHLLNPSQVPSRANIFALKQLGVTHVIATGAVGSLRDDLRPRDLVIPDQIIDKTSRRPGTFYEHAAVHVEFSEPFCPILRQILVEAGKRLTGNAADGQSAAIAPTKWADNAQAPQVRAAGAPAMVHEAGCYVCMEGPAFSTRAESLMHRLWGGDLIGMTLMPEAKLAREAEIAYAAVALVTDYDSWRSPAKALKDKTGQPAPLAAPDPEALLKEITGNLESAVAFAMSLIKETLALMGGRQEELMRSPALGALRLGIWSEKSKIARDEVERLAPLWGKYFQE